MDKPLDCRGAIKLLCGYTDRDLSPDELKLVQEHLDKCPCCADAFRWEESILRSVKKCCQEAAHVPPEVQEAILKAIRGNCEG